MVRRIDYSTTSDFASVYRHELPIVVALVWTITGNRELSFGLAHEAMSRAYSSWKSVGSMERPGVWIRRVAINLADDAVRRAILVSDQLAVVSGWTPPVSSDAGATEFWKAIRALPQRLPAVVALFYLENLTESAIAEILGLPADAVSASLLTARHSLAESLDAQPLLVEAVDEIGLKAGRATLVDAAALVLARTDMGLEELLYADAPLVTTGTSQPARRRPKPRQRAIPSKRWIRIVRAVGALAVLGFAIVNGMDRAPVTHPPTAAVREPVTAATSFTLPTTEGVATTVSPGIAPSQFDSHAVSVDAANPPPAFSGPAFMTIDASTDPTQFPLIALADFGMVVVQPGTTTATVYEWDKPGPPAQRTVSLSYAPFDIHAGPGHVLYGIVAGPNHIHVGAFALSGDLEGTEISGVPVNQLWGGELRHGPNGISDRWGPTVVPYVDENREPIQLPAPAHAMTVSPEFYGGNDLIVHDPDGGHDWHLVINRAAEFSTVGNHVAASSGGGAILWTTLSPQYDSSGAFLPHVGIVMAVLSGDGTGTWYSLADGWQIGASDVQGTILEHRVGDKVELVRVDPNARLVNFLDRPARLAESNGQYGRTLPTTLTTAPLCTAENLDFARSDYVATTMGNHDTATGIEVRNAGVLPCELEGPPDISLLDDEGRLVRRSSPATQSSESAALPIVLLHNSWAYLNLGTQVGNACQGKFSTQLRLTVGGSSRTFPFRLSPLHDPPYDPTSCGPDTTVSKSPLLITDFSVIPPNDMNTTDPFGHLELTLDAPPTVRVGEVLHYDVVLTDLAVNGVLSSIRVCPNYSQSIGIASGEFQLNCKNREWIVVPPGHPDRFHIELLIPADTPIGPTTLTWETTLPVGRHVTVPITVLP